MRSRLRRRLVGSKLRDLMRPLRAALALAALAAAACATPCEELASKICACEGSLACSTCHVIVAKEWYDKLSPATEDEEDMLDLAFGLTATSRLGCQIIMTKDLDGLEVTLPAATRNMQVDKK